ncbi:MCE family protein [Falsihalocynthiibacter arcticus]|uniref:MCE family protein n=1 Tax=Falsihalocynthiibacter arcticus TaxID=1579316 RepID=UPI00300244BE
METRANFVLIGAFTLAGLVGIMAFFLWFAQAELDRQFAYYDIRFSSVSGLDNASDVRFSGLAVGQVVDVRLTPERDGTILVRIEVDAETPVRIDSVATVESQGVTGVSYIGIDAGTPSAALLMSGADGEIPEITAGRSALQSLSEDAPQLLERSLQIVDELGQMLGDDNKNRVEQILVNIEDASGEFSRTLSSFSGVADTVADFADQINQFNATLDTLTGDLSEVLATADTTLVSIRELSEQGKGVLSDSSKTLTDAQGAIIETKEFIAQDLSTMADELRATNTDLRAQLTLVAEDARHMMATFSTTGERATQRLEEAQATLEGTNTLIQQLDDAALAVENVATRTDTLIRDEGAPLLTETRAMVAEANRAIQPVATIATEDLPAIIADIRAATESSRKVITELGHDLKAAGTTANEVMVSARDTLEDARVSFANANVTMSTINDAMETGDRALASAEQAFNGADRVINDDLAGIIAGLKTTLDGMNTAIGKVSDDLPEISDDLRAASAAASDAFEQLRQVADASGPAVRDFATVGLPLYTRLAQESRTLIDNLDRLTSQIQRDPTRLFLDRETPEFKR